MTSATIGVVISNSGITICASSTFSIARRIAYGEYKPDREFSPFPPTGLVKFYEPFIRTETNEYCKKYPRVPRQDMLIEAVRLATIAESKFKPGFRNGNDFSTYMRHWLKGLNRFAQNYSRRTLMHGPAKSLMCGYTTLSVRHRSSGSNATRRRPLDGSPAYRRSPGREAVRDCTWLQLD